MLSGAERSRNISQEAPSARGEPVEPRRQNLAQLLLRLENQFRHHDLPRFTLHTTWVLRA